MMMEKKASAFRDTAIAQLWASGNPPARPIPATPPRAQPPAEAARRSSPRLDSAKRKLEAASRSEGPSKAVAREGDPMVTEVEEELPIVVAAGEETSKAVPPTAAPPTAASPAVLVPLGAALASMFVMPMGITTRFVGAAPKPHWGAIDDSTVRTLTHVPTHVCT